MIFTTKELIGPDDILVNDWTIFLFENTRHIFGFSMQTGLWQVSSPILEDTENYIRTRSRKYFKGAPMTTSSPIVAISELMWLLQTGWGLTSTQLDEIAASVISPLNEE